MDLEFFLSQTSTYKENTNEQQIIKTIIYKYL